MAGSNLGWYAYSLLSCQWSFGGFHLHKGPSNGNAVFIESTELKLTLDIDENAGA